MTPLQCAKLKKASASAHRGSRADEPAAYDAEGILYLPADARFGYLLIRKSRWHHRIGQTAYGVLN